MRSPHTKLVLRSCWRFCLHKLRGLLYSKRKNKNVYCTDAAATHYVHFYVRYSLKFMAPAIVLCHEFIQPFFSWSVFCLSLFGFLSYSLFLLHFVLWPKILLLHSFLKCWTCIISLPLYLTWILELHSVLFATTSEFQVNFSLLYTFCSCGFVLQIHVFFVCYLGQ